MKSQMRLMQIAAAFLALFSLVLSVSPILKYHSIERGFRWIHWIGYFIVTVGFFFLHYSLGRNCKRPDPILLPIIYLLTGWGLLTIFRLSTFFGIRQTIWITAILALAILLSTRRTTYFPFLEKYSKHGVLLGLLLLAATLIWGVFPGGQGPDLWLQIFGVNIQPTEFLKVLFIIYLSASFSKNGKEPKIRTLFFPVLVFSVILVILIYQSDFGTAFIFLIIFAAYLYFLSGKKRVFGIIVLVFLLFAGIGYQFFDIFSTRITAWLTPWGDASGGAYQIIQSVISIAAGGILGAGPGLGYPNVVPLAHSDFIFSAIAEETGLIGSSAILLLYGLILSRGYKKAKYAGSSFQRLLAAGLTTYILVQALLIIGGTVRLLPITGVTLPLVSYGGSSYLSAFFALFLILFMDIPQENGKAVKSNNTRIDLNSPISILGSLFLIALLVVTLTLFWWGLIQADGLQARSDNPRLIFADQFVPRGTIYDRDYSPLALSIGEPGSLYRLYPYPALSNTVGFSHSRYGRTGIEEVVNGYLRGYIGYTQEHIWITHLLYDQPPEGIDVRLTIDLDIQKELDDLFGDSYGAGIILDADSGEILAIASKPGYDANLLDQYWQEWNQDEDAPFLNRVTQGSYPAGSVLTPFLLDQDSLQNSIFQTFDNIDSSICPPKEEQINTFFEALQDGCLQAHNLYQATLTQTEIQSELDEFNFFSLDPIGLFQAPIQIPGMLQNGERTEIDQIRVSPYLVAQALYQLGGKTDQANLSLIYDPIFPIEEDSTSSVDFAKLSSDRREFLLSDFFEAGIEGWEFIADAQDENGTYQWVLSSNSDQENEKRTIAVIVLEKGTTDRALFISRSILALVNENFN